MRKLKVRVGIGIHMMITDLGAGNDWEAGPEGSQPSQSTDNDTDPNVPKKSKSEFLAIAANFDNRRA